MNWVLEIFAEPFSFVCWVGFDRLVERCLGQFVDERKAKLLERKCLPVEACSVVAGRTDKGVTALQQVCSFCMPKKENAH